MKNWLEKVDFAILLAKYFEFQSAYRTEKQIILLKFLRARQFFYIFCIVKVFVILQIIIKPFDLNHCGPPQDRLKYPTNWLSPQKRKSWIALYPPNLVAIVDLHCSFSARCCGFSDSWFLIADLFATIKKFFVDTLRWLSMVPDYSVRFWDKSLGVGEIGYLVSHSSPSVRHTQPPCYNNFLPLRCSSLERPFWEPFQTFAAL